MNEWDVNKMRLALGVEPVHTGGINNGVILRFKNIYFKVYDGKGMNYVVQVWKYGRQMPDIVDTVNTGSVVRYIHYILNLYHEPLHERRKHGREAKIPMPRG